MCSLGAPEHPRALLLLVFPMLSPPAFVCASSFCGTDTSVRSGCQDRMLQAGVA